MALRATRSGMTKSRARSHALRSVVGTARSGLYASAMYLRDFALIVLICAVWAMNNVISKIVVSELHVPPLFYAVARSAVIVLAVAPWLFPMPRPAWRTLAVGMLMGGGSFAMLFIGLLTATPSAAAIVSQLGVPMVTLLSVLALGERVRWRRGLGIALAVTGVVIVM